MSVSEAFKALEEAQEARKEALLSGELGEITQAEQTLQQVEERVVIALERWIAIHPDHDPEKN